jgi:hypothetical protein
MRHLDDVFSQLTMPVSPDILTPWGAAWFRHKMMPVMMVESSVGWFDVDEGD